jgi:hypothetical protein
MNHLRVIEGGTTTKRALGAIETPTLPAQAAIRYYAEAKEKLSEEIAALMASLLESHADGGWHHNPSSHDTWSDDLQGILEEIGRLKPGWAGNGSVAPHPGVVKDIQTIVALLPLGTKKPSVEVDPSDGEVKLAWRSDAEPRALAITVCGDRKAKVIQSDLNRRPSVPFSEIDLASQRTPLAGRMLQLLENSDLFKKAQ